MNGPTDVINSESSNPLQTAIAAGMFLAAPRSVSFESRKVAYVLVPQADGSGKIEYVDQPEAPLRATGTYTFDLVESFVEFLNAHKDASTTIYTRRLDYGPQVHHLFNATAIINEHEKDLGAQFRDFRALLHPPFSESFKVWMGSNGKAFDGNVAFAEFLEDPGQPSSRARRASSPFRARAAGSAQGRWRCATPGSPCSRCWSSSIAFDLGAILLEDALVAHFSAISVSTSRASARSAAPPHPARLGRHLRRLEPDRLHEGVVGIGVQHACGPSGRGTCPSEPFPWP
jgi:hypothetical protein